MTIANSISGGDYLISICFSSKFAIPEVFPKKAHEKISDVQNICLCSHYFAPPSQHCQAPGPSRPPDGGSLPGAVGDGEEADRLGWQATALRAWGTEVFLVF